MPITVRFPTACRLLSILAIALLATSVSSSVASAQQSRPTEAEVLELDEAGPFAPGNAITVDQSGFAPGAIVSITLENDDNETVLTTQARADAAGRIIEVLSIPTDSAEGTHRVTATGSAPDGTVKVFSTEVVVDDPATPGIPTGQADADGADGEDRSTTTAPDLGEPSETLPFVEDEGDRTLIPLATTLLAASVCGVLVWLVARKREPA